MSRTPSARAFVLSVAGISLTLGLALAYVGAWYDLIRNGRVQSELGSVIAAVPESIGYLFGWVLPYWWLPLLVFVLGSTFLATAVRFLLRRSTALPPGAA